MPRRSFLPYLKTVIFLLLALMAMAPVQSQAAGSEWYFAWGYNRDFWAPSDIHISQPALHNDFTIHEVKALDYPQWNDGPLYKKDLTVPQFNLRYGWFLDTQHVWAVEFSIDHTKYNTTPNQVAHVTGTIAGQPVDQDQALTPTYFSYKLHNGVNHVMLSLVKRTPLLGDLNENWSLSLLVKGGFGIIVPHAESTIMGNDSDVGPKKLGNAIGTDTGWWQLNGWTTGAEAALRMVTAKPVWIELGSKVAYAHLAGIPVYQGRARQNLYLTELLFTLGFTVNASAGP